MEDNLMRDIQWFPGHMTKTRRMIKANLSQVDAVVEILDARIPESSRNPEMDKMIGSKPRMFLLNKSDMANPEVTQKWVQYYKKKGIIALPVDCRSGKGINNFIPTVKQQLLADLIEKWNKKGMVGNAVRLMVVGIPNVGKSSFINRIAKSKKTKVEDRPGVTRTKQWVRLEKGIELLDLPGVLWPKFEDQNAARKLAFTGAIKDDIMDTESLAMIFLKFMAENFPSSFERFKFVPEDEMTPLELLETTARKRGMLISGGEADTERAAVMVLDEFRSGKLGRITLELPTEEGK
jgi:ribosome biogenesis GTPase A